MRDFKNFQELIKWLDKEKILYFLDTKEKDGYIYWNIDIHKGQLTPIQDKILENVFGAENTSRPLAL